MYFHKRTAPSHVAAGSQKHSGAPAIITHPADYLAERDEVHADLEHEDKMKRRRADLKAALDAIDIGLPHSRRFESWVKDTMEACFFSDLMNAEEQIRTESGSKRFELIFDIIGVDKILISSKRQAIMNVKFLRGVLQSAAATSGQSSKSARGYDAFLSYSHRANVGFAKTLQWMLEHFGSPLPLRRRMRIFRDDTNLAANPDLWGNIESALGSSRSFLLLASPEAARSRWVVKELELFLATKDPSRLCILLVEGTTPWTDPKAPSEDRRAIPPVLETHFRTLGREPLVVDMRGFVKRRPWRLRFDDEFLNKAASVVAAVLAEDKDKIFGAHIRAQRYSIISLATAAVVFALVGMVAVVQSRLAERRLNQAVGVAERIHVVVDRRLEEVAGAAAARKELLASSGALLDELLGEAKDNSGALYQRMVAHVHEGDLALSRGASEEAEASYEIAWQIGGRLLRIKPNNLEWKRYLSVVLDRIGDLQADRGSLRQALNAYERSRQISEQLVAADPRNSRSRRDLSVSHSKIGGVYERMGDLDSSAEAYARESDIDRALVAEAPSDADRLHDLHGALHRAGTLNVRRGRAELGCTQLDEARTIIERLAAVKPDNALLQSDLAANLSTLGNLREEQGQYAQALGAYRQALAVQAELRRREPKNANWAGRVAISMSFIGDMERATGHLDAALKSLAGAESIQATLLKEDPRNLSLAVHLMRTLMFKGDVLAGRGDQHGALTLFERARERLDEIIRAEVASTDYADVLSSCLGRLADLYVLRGQLDQALHVAQRDVELSQSLRSRMPDSARVEQNLAASLSTLGDIQIKRGDREAGLQMLNQAREIIDKRAAKGGWNRRLAVAVGRTLHSVALSFAGIDKTDLAEASLQQALVLLTLDNANEEERGIRANVLQLLGAIDLQKDRRQEAGNRCAEALLILEPLHASAPDNAHLAVSLAATLSNLGDVQRSQGAASSALQSYERSRVLLERWASATDVADQANLAGILERIGLVNEDLGAYESALAAHQRSLELAMRLYSRNADDPVQRRGVAVSQKHLADLHLSRGSLELAEEGFHQLLWLTSEIPELSRLHSDAQIGLGDLAWKRGDRRSARRYYETALQIREDQAAHQPGDVSLQDDLRVALDCVAKALADEGERDAAYKLRRRSVEIAQRLLAADAHSVFRQHGLSTALFNIGDWELQRGRTALAKESFLRALEIDEAIAVQEPDVPENQESLATTLDRLTEVHIARGEFKEARILVDRALDLRERLVQLFPDHETWQRALTISLIWRGELLRDQGDLSGALRDYRRSLAIGEGLLAPRPEDPTRKRFVSVSLEHLGNLYTRLGQADQALSCLERTRDLRRELLAAPGDVGDPYLDLSITLRQLGGLHLNRGDGDHALDAFTEARNLMESRVQANDSSLMPALHRELAAVKQCVGIVHSLQGDLHSARDAFEQARGIAERLVALDPTNADWQSDLAAYTVALGDTHLARGETRLAEEAYASALLSQSASTRSNPTNAKARRDLSVTLNRLGDAARKGNNLDLAQVRYEQARDAITAVSLIEADNATWQNDVGFTEQCLATLAAQRDTWKDALHYGANAFTAYLLALELDPGNSTYRTNLGTAYSSLTEYVRLASHSQAQWELKRLFAHAVVLQKAHPQSARSLGIAAAALAFDTLQLSDVAAPMLEQLYEAYPSDVTVLGNRAELALARWHDPAAAQTAIARFSAQTDSPETRAVARAFELACSVLRGDVGTAKTSAASLLEIVDQLGEQTHLGSFAGLRAELSRRKHPDKGALVALFEVLEVDDSRVRRASLKQLLMENGWTR